MGHYVSWAIVEERTSQGTLSRQTRKELVQVQSYSSQSEQGIECKYQSVNITYKIDRKFLHTCVKTIFKSDE